METRLPLAVDFGDAPDTGAGTGVANYNTLATDSGPDHTIVSTLYMGASVDGEAGTLQNNAANADDVNQAVPDDEDGLNNAQADLTLTIGAQPTVSVIVTNTTGSTATLHGWIDYNRNGAFDNSTERASINVITGTNRGIATLTFPAVPQGFTGDTYARFRLSTDSAAANPTGSAINGEVEDYVATITASGGVTASSFVKIASNTGGGPSLSGETHFGQATASLGDFDSDGVSDIVVGDIADSNRGAIYVVYLNSNGSAKATSKIASGLNGGPTLAADDFFGISVASIGDLDGDGVTDLAVGAEGDDTGGSGRGAVYVLLMNSNGTVKGSLKIADQTNGGPTLSNGDKFGRSVTAVGDLDSDGIVDLAVGAYGDSGGTAQGAVHILFMNTNGTVRATAKIANQTGGGPTLVAGDQFGVSLAGIGDLDADGVPDMVVGADGDDTNGTGRGAVYAVFMKSDGTAKSTSKIADQTGGGPNLVNADSFGRSVSTLGDLDGNGVTDIAVGAVEDRSATFRGAFHLLMMNSNGTVSASYRIAHQTAGGPTLSLGDQFGYSVTRIGDLNANGIIELAVGAWGDDTGASDTGAVYVVFLNPPASFTLTINPSSIGENAGVATGTVTRNNSDISNSLTVSIASNDTSEASVPSTVTILANQTSVAFPITGVDDSILDGSQTVTITASATGFVADTEQLTVTDHETVTLAVDPPSISEKGGTATGTITRSNTDNAAQLVVSLTNNDTSEISIPATVTIAANQASNTFTITGVDDSILDGTQIVTINVSAANYVSGANVVNVTDYEALILTVDPSTISEIGSATGTVTRTNSDVNSTLTINLLNGDNTELSLPNSVTLAPNQLSETFLLTGIDDGFLDGTQTVTISATANGYITGLAAVDVTDSEALTLFITPNVMSENGGTATGTVFRDNTNITEGLVIQVMSSDTTEATVFAQVQIPPNQTSATFTINAVDDLILDGSQTVTITVSSSGYVSDSEQITVTDFEPLTMVFNPTSISENGGISAATLSRPSADPQELVVTLTSDDTTEATVPATATIPANATSVVFNITGVDDTILDGPELVTITATATGYVTGTEDIVVTDFEPLTLAIDPGSMSEFGGTVTGTVTRHNTDIAQSIVVNISSNDTTEASVPTTVTIPANQTSQTFTISAVDDLLLDGPQTATITVSRSGYISGSNTVTVTDYETVTMTFNPSTISENGGLAAGTLTRSNTDNSAPLTVNLTSSDTTEATVVASVTIPANQASAPFNVPAVDDTIVDGTQTVTITATAVAYITGTTTINVSDFELLTVSIDAGSMSENGGTATGTVTRNNTDIALPLVVNMTVNDATEGSVPATVTIAANQVSETFPISAVDDTLLDGTQTLAVTASASGYISGTGNIDVLDFETFLVSMNPGTISENGGASTVTVTRSNTDISLPLTVSLSGNDATEATVPASVTIPANQPSASFNVPALDDNILDGTQIVTISASATGYFIGTGNLNVADFETLSVSFGATSIGENGGTATGTVTRNNSDLSMAVTVNLSSNDTGEATVPSTITIPVNQASAVFVITGADDALLDGSQTVTVTASSPVYVSGTKTITVTDHEVVSVTINPASISENGGVATGTLTRSNTDIGSQLVVNLSSNDVSEATVPTTVTIPANEASAIFSITAVDDSLLDGNRSALITTSATGYVPDSKSVTVLDHETLTVSINPTTMSEGGGSLSGTVTRGNTDILSALTVNLSSSDTTEATVQASITILANQTTASFTVTAVDDSLLDGTQNVTITAAAAGYISGTSNVSVTDIEVITLAINPGSLSENGGTATGTITRENTDVDEPVTINLSSSDTSEATVPLTVTIPASATSATFTITGVDDSLLDGTQGVLITASADGYDPASASVSVSDFEALSLSITPASISENGGTATATVTRSNIDIGQLLVVNLSNSDTSEASVPSAITIAANQTSASFTVTAVDDTLLDGTQSVNITASATGYVLGTRTVDVTDFEALAVTVSLTSLSENSETATGTVTRNNTDISQALTVNLSSSDMGEATVPATVTIPASQTSATFTVSAVDDTLLDGTQSVTITSSAAGYVSGTRMVSITDHETLTLTLNQSSMSENGGTISGTVTRSNTDNTQALTVNLSSNDTSEATVPVTVVIAANQNSAPFSINAVDDALLDGTQNVTITSSAAGYVSGTSSISVTDSELLTLSIPAGSISEMGGTVTATVTRNNSDISQALVVNLLSSDVSEATVPATVTISANQTSATFTITAVDDTLLDGTQTVNITASATGYVSGAGTVDVVDVELLALSINPGVISENGGVATATVTRSNTDISQALVVNLASSDTTEATVPASITIPANQSSMTFTVTAVDDVSVDAAQSVTVTATSSGYVSGTSVVEVTDDEGLTLTTSSSSMSENGGTMTGTLTRGSANISQPLVVNLSSNDTTEATVPASVTIPASQVSATFTITAVDDTLLDGSRPVQITATATGFFPDTRTINITDHETLSFTLSGNSMSEFGGSVTGTVTRNNTDIAGALVVTITSSDTSEASVPSTVTILANQTSAIFTISAIDDFQLDGTQTANIGVAATGYIGDVEPLSVTDHETLSVSIVPSTISENGGSATGTVTRNNLDTGAALTVNLSSSDSTEATVPVSVTIPAGSASTTFAITSVDDALLDGQQSITITVSASGYVSGSSSLGVTDSETLSLSISPASISENGGSATGTITRNNTDISSAVTVVLTSNDATEATVPASVTIPAGQASTTFTITAVNDNLLDGTQTATINATSAGYVAASRTVDVTDHETLTVSISGSSISENGGFTTATVARSNTDISQPLVVNLASSDSSEATVPASVTIPANQTSATFSITAVDDTLLDGTQTVTVSASSNGYVTGTKTIDIVDTELVALSLVTNTMPENGGTISATVTRSNTDNAAPLTVNLSSNDSTEATVPTTVTIPAGSSSTTFTISAVDDNLLDGTQTATISASAAGYVSDSKSVTVTDVESLTLVINASATSENGGTVTATVTRSNTDNGQPVTVNLASSDTGEATVPLTVTIPAGFASVSFNVTGVDDSILDGTQIVTISAVAPPYVSSTDTVDVTDHETLTVQIAPSTMSELNGSVTGTVTRSNTDIGQPLLVTLSTDDPTEVTLPPTITIPAGQASATFTVNSVDDALLDGTRRAMISGAASGYVGVSGFVDVTDVETLTISAAVSTMSESAGTITGTITRNNSDISSTLIVALSSNDASEATVPATVTIAANQTSASFTISSVDDSVLDGSQSVTITGAATGYTSDSMEIDVEDHEPLVLTFTVNSLPENGGTVNATVTRVNNDNDQQLVVQLSSSDTTEATVPSSVTIAANQDSVDFVITVLDDTLMDGVQNVTISAAATGHVTGTKTLAVTDVESMMLTITDISISENGGTTTGTVTRNNTDIGQPLTITLASNDPGEATAPSFVVIAANQASATFSITGTDDNLLDGTQIVTISASATNYTDVAATVRVTDHETVSLSILPASISEKGGSATATVTRSNTDNSSSLTVDLSNSDLSEANLPPSVVIPANQASATFNILGVDDNLLDGTQTVSISAFSAGYATDTKSVDITDFEALTLGINPGVISESGGTATGTVSRSNADRTQPLTVNLSSSDTSEATVPATVVIPANQSTATFTITAADDNLLDGSQLPEIIAAATGYISANTTLEVTDRETLSLSINPTSMSENGGTAVGTVSRSNTDISQSLTVSLSSGDPTEATVPATVVIPPGASSITFVISAVDDTVFDGTQTVTINATEAAYIGASANVSITDHEALTVTIDKSSMSENNGSAIGTLTRSPSDIAQSKVVTLSVSDTSEATVPATVTIPANQVSVTFPISSVDDSLLDGTQTITITATGTPYFPGSASLDVTDHEVLTLNFTLSSISENGGTAIGTVGRSNTDISQPLDVSLTSADGGEVTVPASVTIPANQGSVQFTITAVDDDLFDQTQTVAISASAAGYQSVSRNMDILDHELLSLSLDQSSISENGGKAILTITRHADDTSSPLTVTLTNPDTSELNMLLSVTIPTNQTSATVELFSVDDTILDGTQSLNVSASAARYASNMIALQVTDFEPLTISLAASSIPEQGGSTQATIQRVTDITSPLTVQLASNDLSEALVPNSIQFPAGVASMTVSVNSVDDNVLDGTQIITLTATATGFVSGSTNLSVTDSETLTIVIADDQVAENGTALSATITRNNTDISQALTVNLASSDTSEATLPANVVIPAGQTSATFAIQPVDDNALDGEQIVTLTAAAAGYLDGTSMLHVADHETLSLTINQASIAENGGQSTATVSRSNTDTAQSLSVTIVSNPGGRVTVSSTILIPAGAQSSDPFSITGLDNQVLEGDVAVQLDASASGYVGGSDSVTIIDQETLTLTITRDSMSELSETSSATIKRNNVNLESELVVQLASSVPGKATVPATVTIPANQSTATFSVSSVDNNLLDGSVSVTITAAATGYLDTTDVVSITDAESLEVVVGTNSMPEFAGRIAGTVRRSNSNIDQPLTVNLASSDSSEAVTNATVVIAAGATEATFDINAVDDTELDGAKQVTVTVSASGYESDSVQVTVTDQEALALSVTVTTVPENGGPVTATVSRSNTDVAAALTVNVSSSNSAQATAPATVTIPANQSSATFDISIIDDDLLDGSQSVTFTASASGYEAVSQTIDVTDHEQLSVALAAASVLEASGSTSGTVTRGNSDMGAALVVSLLSSDTSEATVPATVTIPAGAASAVFPITIVDDGVTDGTQVLSITVSATGYESASDDLEVVENRFPWQNISNRYDVNKDGFVTPIDALVIINDLNARNPRELPAPDQSLFPPPYLDVNGDNFVTPTDVLNVINYLNSLPSPEGESGGEWMDLSECLVMATLEPGDDDDSSGDESQSPRSGSAELAECYANIQPILAGESNANESTPWDSDHQSDDWEDLLEVLADDTLRA